MKMRLKDNHPTMDKVAQIFELCDKLGISFRYTRAGTMMVDVDGGSPDCLYLQDADSSLPCPIIPHPVEYKLTYEK